MGSYTHARVALIANHDPREIVFAASLSRGAAFNEKSQPGFSGRCAARRLRATSAGAAGGTPTADGGPCTGAERTGDD